ncbi:MAG TPA: hypothetical protein VF636_08795 [Sphingomonas sp.]
MSIIGAASPITRASAATAPPRSSTPERALEAITSAERPIAEGLAQWSSLSSAERLRTASGAPEPRIELARAEVRNGRVFVIPERDLRSDLPTLNLPNNVGARGFSPGLMTHDYLVPVLAPRELSGPAGLAAVGRALVANPTPGRDQPSSPTGTRNDVGGLPYLPDGGDNFVRSYVIPSSDPRRSAAVVNYTIRGEHALNEGFVLRFAELRRDGRIELVTYGEGNALKQSEAIELIWGPMVTEAWAVNANEVFRAALGR